MSWKPTFRFQAESQNSVSCLIKYEEFMLSVSSGLKEQFIFFSVTEKTGRIAKKSKYFFFSLSLLRHWTRE